MVILCELAGRGDADIAPYGVRWRKTVGQDLPRRTVGVRHGPF